MAIWSFYGSIDIIDYVNVAYNIYDGRQSGMGGFTFANSPPICWSWQASS